METFNHNQKKDVVDKLVDKLPPWLRPTKQVLIAWGGFMTIVSAQCILKYYYVVLVLDLHILI